MNTTSIPSLSALGGVVIALASASQAFAAITFVDAVHGASGNTRQTGQLQSNTSWLSTANNTTANNTQWVTRTGQFNGGILQSIATSLSTFPEITTTISGLTNGLEYNIWVFFVDNNPTVDQWQISAGLTTGALTSYRNPADTLTGTTGVGVVNTATLDFTTTIVKSQASGASILFGVNLGPVVASGTSIDVFVDRLVQGSSSGNRVWYDGVGYEAIPEPSAALLGGLGLLALLRRRRD